MNKNSLFKEPLTWLVALGGSVAIAIPLIIDYQTPRIMSGLLTDISESDQPYKKELVEICQANLEHLKDNDISIVGKFADKVKIEKNQEYDQRDRFNLQKDCENITSPPSDLGKTPGTDLQQAVIMLKQEIDQQHTVNKKYRIAVIINVQAAEPVNHKNSDLQVIRKTTEEITKDGSAVVFIGPDAWLQQDLKTALVGVKNTQVCSYKDGKNCVNWAFNTARGK